MAGLSGVINVYKPKGITSHDVIYKLRRILNIKKIGHTGTLDPDAEGVLPVCVGRATKTADMLTASDKEYLARVALGSSTDTQDGAGKVIMSVNMNDYNVSVDDIKSAAAEFLGDTLQIPPMFSAIKVGGKKLYELARQGIEIERKPRPVRIDKIEVSDCAPDNAAAREFSMRVACSKGTYIRTLCHDIGDRLGCYAHMTGLIRTRSGRFDVSESYTLEQIAEMYAGGDTGFLTSIDKVFEEFDAVTINDKAAKMMTNGVRVHAPNNTEEGKTYRVYDRNGKFLTISRRENDRLTILKTFYQD